MDLFEQKNYSIVLISKKAKEFVSIPEKHDFNILEAQDVKKEINHLIDKWKGTSVLAVIFLVFDEYLELNQLISVLPFTDISYQIILFGKLDDIKNINFENFKSISEFSLNPITDTEFNFIVRKTFFSINDAFINRSLQENYLCKLIDNKQDQEDLIDIGKSLSIEKDPDKLLRLILFLSKRITRADAGSIYLIEVDENGNKRLRFKYSHTYSRDLPLEEFVMDMNKKSIAGYVAVTGEVQNLPDVYKLPDDKPYSHNSSIDKQNKYLTRSMLAVPMKNHLDQIIGVIQLLNSKENPNRTKDTENEAFTLKLEKPEDFDNFVMTFDEKYDGLMEAVASQAAISIENNKMIRQIEEQFEEFVKASVIAIESRDPATSGHSFRVSEICKEMAYAVNDVSEGYLGKYKFSESEIRELEFAALLHDFGKVYIDLAIFKKAKKLYPKDLDNLNLRLSYLYKYLELQYSVKGSELLKKIGTDDTSAASFDELTNERNEKLENIRAIKTKLVEMNEPSVMDIDPEKVIDGIIKEIEVIECINIDGEKLNIISQDDHVNLCIKRGSLNPLEREEIESHVRHTYNFVSKIPWPSEYKNIPEIALRHHEKINGKGYPDGLKGKESTMLQSRMMAIADVFDALSATDRPYKKAVPLDIVLKILMEEAENDILDKDLVELFISCKLYEKVEMDARSYSLEENASS